MEGAWDIDQAAGIHPSEFHQSTPSHPAHPSQPASHPASLGHHRHYYPPAAIWLFMLALNVEYCKIASDMF